MKEWLHHLLSAQPYPITEVAKEQMSATFVSGVYAISQRDGNEILYVGRNVTATVAKRAWQHVNTPGSSDLKSMIKLYTDLPSDLDNYTIRWVEIQDARDRHFFEAFAMSVLEPRMNFKEKTQQNLGGDSKNHAADSASSVPHEG